MSADDEQEEDTCPICGAPYDHSRTERGTATPRLRPDAVACKSAGVGRERTVYVHLDGTPPAKLGSSPVTTPGPDPVGVGVPPFDPDDDGPAWLLDEAAENLGVDPDDVEVAESEEVSGE